MKACKSNQCFLLCNQPLHDLVSHQTPHFSTQLKSTKLMSILLKLSVQHVRTACRKPRDGLEQVVQQDLIANLFHSIWETKFQLLQDSQSGLDINKKYNQQPEIRNRKSRYKEMEETTEKKLESG